MLAGIAVCLVSVGGAVWWVLAGAHGPIERTRLDAIPPYVMNAIKSDARPRLLAIDLSNGSAGYAVMGDDHIRLGDADRGFTFGGSAPARDQVDDLVVRLVAGTADSDISPQLADLGIGYVWVTGASQDVQARIDNTPGLGTASGNERGDRLEARSGCVAWGASRTAERDCRSVGHPHPYPWALSSVSFRSVKPPTYGGEPISTADRLPRAADGWQQVFLMPSPGGDRDLRPSFGHAMAAAWRKAWYCSWPSYWPRPQSGGRRCVIRPKSLGARRPCRSSPDV